MITRTAVTVEAIIDLKHFRVVYITKAYTLMHTHTYKNIDRHTAYTIVSWPNPKQGIIVHTSDLMMIIRQRIYKLPGQTIELAKVLGVSPVFQARYFVSSVSKPVQHVVYHELCVPWRNKTYWPSPIGNITGHTGGHGDVRTIWPSGVWGRKDSMSKVEDVLRCVVRTTNILDLDPSQTGLFVTSQCPRAMEPRSAWSEINTIGGYIYTCSTVGI